MSIDTKPRRSDPWVNPPSPAEEPGPEYEAYVREKIARGQADIKAGRVTPIEEVRKELGLE